MFELETIEDYVRELFHLPELQIKKEWIRIFHEMAVHTRKRKPTELLLAMRPNEEEHVRQYRDDNFEPITYAPINKAFDTINRLLTELNYNIVTEDNVQEYLKQKNFLNYTFNVYMQKAVLRRDIEDPNGFLVWIPEGQGVIDSSVKVMPKPYLLYSEQLIYFDDKIFIFLSDEINYYKVPGDEALHAGKVYWFIDKQEIWKAKQVGPDPEKDIEGEMFYSHQIGEFPIIQLGGDLTAEHYNESFFGAFNAMGNQCIRQFSDHQAIMVTSGYPVIEEFATECEIKTKIPRALDSPETDPTEKYSQTIQLKPYSKGPYGIVMRPIKASDGIIDFEGTLPVEIPHRRYITPDVNIAKYSGELWMQYRDMAQEDLSICTTKIAQSGVAKEYDNETKYSMIGKICNNLFDNIILNSVKYIDCFLNKKPFANSNAYINKPTTFSIKTEADLIDEIANLKKNEVPAMFVTQATIALSLKMFAGNPVAKKVFNIISTYDPLFIYSINERSQMLINGVISKEGYVKSVNMPVILLQISQQLSIDNFINTDDKALYDMFVIAVTPLIPQPATPLVSASGAPHA